MQIEFAQFSLSFLPERLNFSVSGRAESSTPKPQEILIFRPGIFSASKTHQFVEVLNEMRAGAA